MIADHRAQARAALIDLAREHGSERWIEARGGSMAPIIRPGDRLLVAIGARPERLGQVVVVQRPNVTVAHRIVGRRRKDPAAPWTTKGDAECLADAAFAADDVIGVVLSIARPDGSIHRYGLDGRVARLIASMSAAGGRLAWILRRLSGRLPGPVAAVALRLFMPLTRVPTRLISAPIPWLDQEIRAERR
jgi:hypothetical protein